jgi:D-beta-D-heptose 7-phosphate kinase/D-beta-D-heptose 1-phosphate adenosyltransferase
MPTSLCPDTAAAAIERFPAARILVVGDIMLDRYVYGTVDRISPEAPVPVVRRTDAQETLGGAGNVAENLLALGAEVALVGVTGRDSTARAVEALCSRHARLSLRLVSDPDRVTTLKMRVVGHAKQMIRIDEETTAPVAAALERAVIEAATQELATCGVVVLSDYAKGVLTPGVCAAIISRARPMDRFVVVDPKTRDLGLYAGADVVCPNLREIHDVTQIHADDDEKAARACAAVLERFDVGAVVLTRSEAGMTIAERGGAPVHIRARRRAVGDVSGAGDTAISAIAAGVAAGLPLKAAVALGNAAAGIAVSKPGTSTVSADELRHELAAPEPHRPASLAAARTIVQAWREAGKIVGFTNGCFDLLHLGHLQALEFAKSECDVLVVGVNSDRSVRALKGPERPVQDEATRARVMASLSFCDLAVVFDEDTPFGLIDALQPDIVFKGADYAADDVVGADIVKARGGRVMLTPLVPGFSTTATVARIRGTNPAVSRLREDALEAAIAKAGTAAD